MGSLNYLKMEENQYYMTIADSIYQMPRKSFIYVTRVCKKAFFYKFIDDWQLVEKERKTHLKINKIEKYNYRGRLADSDAFKKLNRSSLVLSPDCP